MITEEFIFSCQNDCYLCHLFQFENTILKCFSVSMKPRKCYICFPKADQKLKESSESDTLETSRFCCNQIQEDFNLGSSGERK